MKQIVKFAVKNYQFIIIVFVVLLIAGVQSFLKMPRTEDPPTTVPGAVVTVTYPGATPSDIEELVVSPIEDKIDELEDIDEISSTARDGFALINISFNYGNYDFDDKYDDVVQAVNEIKSDLPKDITDIDFVKKTTTDTKIVQLALCSAEKKTSELEKDAERLERLIEKIDGIKNVEVTGYAEKQVKIQVKPDKLLNMGVSLQDISDAIQSNNANIPGGQVNIGKNRFTIQTSGSYNNIEEIKKTVVGSYQGSLIYLRDVATVSFEEEYSKYHARYNHIPCVYVSAEQQDDTNVLTVMDEVQKVVDDFKTELPKSVSVHYVHNQAESVRASVNGFINNLLQGIVVVGLAIFMAIGFRSSLVIIVAIPSSILIGLSIVDLAGFGLQNVSIAALVIALGLLVDNSIVVVENTERYLKEGLSRREAAIKGTSQVAGAITSSTLTTLAAFIPIAMLPDAAGEYIKSLPVTVVATLTVSLVLALTVTPLFLSKIMKKDYAKEFKENRLQRSMDKVITGPYKRILAYCLGHKRSILLFTILVFISALVVFKLFVKVSFFPNAEKPIFMIQAVLPQDKNLEASDEVAEYVAAVLDTIPEIDYYSVNVGHGNPKIYFNQASRNYAENLVEFYVKLKEYDPKKFPGTIERIRTDFSDYSSADVQVKVFQQGTAIQYPVEVIVSGDNMNDLMKVTGDFEHIMKSQEGMVNVNNELEGLRTDLYVNINKDKALILGVPVSSIDQTVRTAMNGSVISKYRDDEGEEYDMVLSLPFHKKASMEDFDNVYVESVSGAQIPLKQLATIEFVTGPNKITHYDSYRSGIVGGDVSKDFNTGEVTQAIKEKLEAYHLPQGTEFKLAGAAKKQGETFGGLGGAAGIAVLVILAILVLQFRSFVQPFIVFMAVPLALTGSFYALFLSGMDFSFSAFVGCIALIGIAINDAIVLIEFANEARGTGKSIYDALMEAGQVRFVPILITSLTTIGGLLPLTLMGGAFWGSLGWTIIGGLTLSTMLVLIIVPVLYLIMVKEK